MFVNVHILFPTLLCYPLSVTGCGKKVEEEEEGEIRREDPLPKTKGETSYKVTHSCVMHVRTFNIGLKKRRERNRTYMYISKCNEMF